MYRSQFGLSAAVVRISWVYGPPLVTDDPPRGPVPAFLRAALAGKPIRLASGADFAASFTYVADVAAGLIAAWRAQTLNHDVYHLGSGENYTARRVADAVRAAVPGAVIELGAGTEPWTIHTRMRGPLAGNRLIATPASASATARGRCGAPTQTGCAPTDCCNERRRYLQRVAGAIADAIVRAPGATHLLAIRVSRSRSGRLASFTSPISPTWRCRSPY
jgi:hypothetical protein